jgi:hypothetical protein
MVDSLDFEPYLRSLIEHYAQWWSLYAFMDEIDDDTWFEFELTSKTQEKPTEPGRKPEEKTQLVLKAIEDYAHEKILIVGSPGAGKSTLLARILWEAAKKAHQDETKTAPIPVLVELKLYPELDIWERIQTTLENCDLYLEILEIKQLVKDKRLLLLADGFNELPTDGARAEFKKFCGRNIPVIVTSRDAADSLGLERKLELQPPSDQQVARFLEERLPNSDRAQLQKLGDRVKDLGQTPLMIWMLYSIFRAKHEIPETRGEAYRAFTTLYAERAKEGIDLTESRFIMSKLAFEMMQSPKPDDPTDFRLNISEVEAQTLVGSEKTLKHLINNHLLQWSGKAGNRKVRFCHQSLQEYYAAEFLLSAKLLKELKEPSERNNKILQQEYLNYLKWTEAIALMLGLVDEGLAMRVVELAIGVDLMLGARLAGEVKLGFQEGAIAATMQNFSRDYPENLSWLKLKILKLMGESAVYELISLLDDPDDSIRYHAHSTLRSMSPEQIPEQHRAGEDSDRYSQILEESRGRVEPEEPPLDPDSVEKLVPSVRAIYEAWVGKELDSNELIERLANIFCGPDPEVRRSAYVVMDSLEFEEVRVGQLGYKSAAIRRLSHIVSNHSNPGERCSAIIVLGIIGTEEIIPGLCQAMQDVNDDVVRQAIETSQKVGSEAIALSLLKVMADHPDSFVRYLAVSRLGSLSSKEDIAKLLSENHLQELVQQLEDSYIDTRWIITFMLWNIASEEVIPLLRPKLTHLNHDIALSAALVLGKFGCHDAAPELLEMMDYSNLENHPDVQNISYLAGYALGQIEGVTSKYLPKLLTLIATASGRDVFHAIAAIQSRCQFYNYEIFQAAQTAEATTQNAEDLIHDKLTAIAQGVQRMSDVPKYSFPNAQKVQIIEQIETYNENNYATVPEVQQALEDLQQTIANLQRQYPQATETEAATIIDAEFTTIQTTQPKRWQNFLKLKRLWNGVKKGSLKVGEHYAEETAWGKGFIGLLEGITDEVE